MKINRRDYLKQMGAAGMLVGAAGLEGFAHDYGYPQASCPADPQCPKPTAPLVWEPRWCEALPSNAERKCVKLIFEGLMGIAPRRLQSGKVVCDVGFHSKGDSPIHHYLSISVYSNVVNPNKCPASKNFDQKNIQKIVLHVPDPDIVDQTCFYQRGPACTRRELAYDEDFRWIVDFESDYLYRKHLSAGSYLQKKKDVYSPVLTVPAGIFYTLQKTASTFLARSDDNRYFMDLGNVALILAANVYVKSGTVTLIVDNVTYTIQPPGEIYFKNHCMQENTGDGKCDFDPYQTDKKKRSDFFLNYKAFDRKGFPEYQLHLLESKTLTKTPDVICERDRLAKTINDESPCSAAGYGGESKGLPPFS